MSPTVVKGELACLKFDELCLEKGLVSCKPILECPFDRVVQIDNRFHRVQIKVAGSKCMHSSGVTIARLTRNWKGHGKGGKRGYEETEIDAIITYIPSNGKFCWFGPEVFKGKAAISIRLKPPKNGQKKKCLMFEDYEW